MPFFLRNSHNSWAYSSFFGLSPGLIIVAFEMLPNYRFVAEIEAKTYAALTDVAQRNRAEGKVLAPLIDAVPQVQTSIPSQDVPTRLANLDSLRAQNLINDEEYAAQRQRILNEL